MLHNRCGTDTVGCTHALWVPPEYRTRCRRPSRTLSQLNMALHLYAAQVWHRHDGVHSRPMGPDRVSHTVSQAKQHMASAAKGAPHIYCIAAGGERAHLQTVVPRSEREKRCQISVARVRTPRRCTHRHARASTVLGCAPAVNLHGWHGRVWR